MGFRFVLPDKMLMGVIEKEATRNASPTAPKRMTRCRSRTIGSVPVMYSYAVSANGTNATTCTNIFRRSGGCIISICLETLPEILCKVAPYAVDVGASVTRVVMFQQEGGTLQAVIVWTLRFK